MARAGAGGPLPDAFGIELDPAVRRLDGGTVVAGGSPLRLLRLTDGGRRLIDRLVAGEPVPPTAGAQGLVRRLLDAGIAHPRPGVSPFTVDDVTVVVPVKDDAAALGATLDAIGRAGHVVVVDDGSHAALRAGVDVPDDVELVRNERSLGPGGAREVGWRRATSPLVAFVDTGCTPEPGWLEPLLAHLADPRVAAVAPRIVTRTAAGAPAWLIAYETARSSLDLGARPGPVRPRSWVPYVPTAVLLVRRDALESLGGFDAALRYGEDVDLVWRLGEAGWTVRYEPAVVASHPMRSTFGAWLRQRYDYGSSAAPLARRHGRALAPLVVSAWSAAAWALAALGFRKSAIALAAGTTAALTPKLRGLQHPAREAVRLGGLGHLYAGRAVADAVTRPWWPFALGAALVSRRARGAVALAVVVPPLVSWYQDRPELGPAPWVALNLVDDVAYGAGVWVGVLRERSTAALVPDLSSWPGRRAALEG